MKNRPDYSDNILKEFTALNLSNFYERSKREFEDFLDIFQMEDPIGEDILHPNGENPYRVLFLETLYTYRISVEQCMDFQNFLLDRIERIET